MWDFSKSLSVCFIEMRYNGSDEPVLIDSSKTRLENISLFKGKIHISSMTCIRIMMFLFIWVWPHYLTCHSFPLTFLSCTSSSQLHLSLLLFLLCCCSIAGEQVWSKFCRHRNFEACLLILHVGQEGLFAQIDISYPVILAPGLFLANFTLFAPNSCIVFIEHRC